MVTERGLMTAEDVLQLPDDGMRHEVIDGELRAMTPAGGEHGRNSGAIHFHLGRFVYENPIACVLSAETGFIIRRNPDRVRAPDVAVVKTDRIAAEDLPTGYIVGVPDLAVEVVSPNNRASEELHKVDE